MDSRIIKALRMLGFSEERIAKFVALVDGANTRARVENMVTRDVPKKPKTIRITYAGKGSRDYKGTAARTLARIKAMQVRATKPVITTEPRRGTPPPPPSAPQWRKDEAEYARRFQDAGENEALPGTHAAIEQSRRRKK